MAVLTSPLAQRMLEAIPPTHAFSGGIDAAAAKQEGFAALGVQSGQGKADHQEEARLMVLQA